MRYILIVIGLSSCTIPSIHATAVDKSVLLSHVREVVKVAVIAAGVYGVIKLFENSYKAERDHIDELIRDAVKNIIIQHKVVTQHEIEDAVVRILYTKYGHLSRERIKKLVHQLVKEEMAPLIEQVNALEAKIHTVL